MACLFLSKLRSTRISRFGCGGMRPAMLRTFLAEIIFDLDIYGVRSCRLCPVRDCAWKGDHQSQSLRCHLAVSDILWPEDFRYLLEIQASHWSAAQPCLGMHEFPIVCAKSAVIYQFSFFLEWAPQSYAQSLTDEHNPILGIFVQQNRNSVAILKQHTDWKYLWLCPSFDCAKAWGRFLWGIWFPACPTSSTWY